MKGDTARIFDGIHPQTEYGLIDVRPGGDGTQIKFNKKIKEAKGAYLYPEKGEPILDFLAQYGAVPFGHNPDDLIQIIKDKLDTHSPGFIQPFVTDASRRLAERLINLAPGKFQYAVFTNSGTETVEAAIKLARCDTKRHVILSAMNGFHGKTMGAVSATANPVYSKPFLVDTQHFDKVPFDDLILRIFRRGGFLR